MNILHVNASLGYGGAARAAYRIHESLRNHGHLYRIDSRFRAVSGASADPTIHVGSPRRSNPVTARLQFRLNRWARSGFCTRNPSWHSIAWPAIGLGKELNQSLQHETDLIHLHWVGEFNCYGDVTLSIEEIGRLRPPLIWTLHDQWPFCGAEHYVFPPGPGETESPDHRYALAYSASSRSQCEQGPDLNRRTWLRKRRAWRTPMQIVCPSAWMADCVRRSTLMGDWPIHVIPNPIDLSIWAPWDPIQARKLLGLPIDRPLLLFGAMDPTGDPRKGADLLFDSLGYLRQQIADTAGLEPELVIFGQSLPSAAQALGFQTHFMGMLQDDLSLRLLYAATDVFVLPSRQDNLPNTGLEAHACGVPVVAFRTGGLADIVDHGTTGYLADPFSPEALAVGIRWVIGEPERQRGLARAARQRAQALWDPARVARQYAEVYQGCLSRNTHES
jgi:glycosyltransferase involved in cell wall biosynthesis